MEQNLPNQSRRAKTPKDPLLFPMPAGRGALWTLTDRPRQTGSCLPGAHGHIRSAPGLGEVTELGDVQEGFQEEVRLEQSGLKEEWAY